MDMERQCWANVQYSRRECLQVAGIHCVSNKNLESKVLEVFSKVGCEILSRNIEACHRLTNSDGITVRFLPKEDWVIIGFLQLVVTCLNVILFKY